MQIRFNRGSLSVLVSKDQCEADIRSYLYVAYYSAKSLEATLSLGEVCLASWWQRHRRVLEEE